VVVRLKYNDYIITPLLILLHNTCNKVLSLNVIRNLLVLLKTPVKCSKTVRNFSFFEGEGAS